MPNRNDQTRDRLLEVAAKLFAERGYHATGMAELGDAVGLARGALYHHIRSKEDLLAEISGRHVEQMVAYGEEVLSQGGDVVPRVRALSRMLLEMIAQNLPELTVFFSEFRSLTGERAEHLLDLRDRFEGVWRKLLDEGVSSGELRLSGPLVVKGLLGLHNYSYLWLKPGGPQSPLQIADLFCDMALDGIVARPV